MSYTYNNESSKERNKRMSKEQNRKNINSVLAEKVKDNLSFSNSSETYTKKLGLVLSILS